MHAAADSSRPVCLLSVGKIVNSFVKLSFCGLALAALYACGTKTGAATACPPNQSVACNCPGTSVPGAQVCLEDGSGFDMCVCEGVGGGGPSSGMTSTTPSSSSQGAPSSATGFTTSGAGGSDPNKGACDTGATCSVCQASPCAIAICKNEKSNCENNPACSGLFECVQTCAVMDSACFNECIQQFMGGTSDLIAYFTCTACKPGPCAGDCKGSLQCQ